MTTSIARFEAIDMDEWITLAGSLNTVLNQMNINPLKTKRRPLYLKTQSVPRCKTFSSRL